MILLICWLVLSVVVNATLLYVFIEANKRAASSRASADRWFGDYQKLEGTLARRDAEISAVKRALGVK